MYLFLDTETTGVPSVRGAPLQARQWPRLVQIAWAAYDEAGKCVETEAHLAFPTDFAIPAAATRIHRISTAMAKSDGRELGWVIERFLGAVAEHGRVIVGHNVAFDRNVVAAEMYRLGYARETVEKELCARRHFCLMTAAAAFCRLPGPLEKPKYPTLTELHRKLFGEQPRRCHSAPADVETTARCFFRLKELGLV